MHPEYNANPRAFGLMVSGGGGAGYPQSAEYAFLDIGNRLARNPENPIRSSDDGYVALEVAELGLLVTGFSEGHVGVACGGLFPQEFLRDTAMRHDAPDDASGGASALWQWPHEKVIVPTDRVGPFLADFSLYLAKCGAAATAGQAAPMFQEFLDQRGINYGTLSDRTDPQHG